MSVASQTVDSNVSRPLRREEKAILCSLLDQVLPGAASENAIESGCVVDMQDGGMGSIRFVRPEPQRFGKVIAEANFLDSDGVLVSVSVNADTAGNLFEIDFWKVDFSRLQRYPTPADLTPHSVAA